MNVISSWKSFGGRQLVLEHDSTTCGVPMRFSLFLPPDVENPPVVLYLSGLTCTWENVTTKGGFQRVAAELGLAVLCPDTSPRGDDVPDVPDRYDLGKGAGFYVDADAEPWSTHYKMYSYVTKELLEAVAEYGVDTSRIGITGHSMGGHGALVLGLRNPDLFSSISAFSPIVAPSQVQWGEDALGAYLSSRDDWALYDATELVKTAAREDITIRIDQGGDDSFLEKQLRPEVFAAACGEAGQPLELGIHDGYDHSYYFVSTFMEAHLKHHAATLLA